MISETFFDHDDGVTRCKLCGHEVWSSDAGFCTGCKAGDSAVPYFEFLDPDAGPRPEILANDLASSDDVDSGHRGEVRTVTFLAILCFRNEARVLALVPGIIGNIPRPSMSGWTWSIQHLPFVTAPL
jgi:hypothetical protein